MAKMHIDASTGASGSSYAVTGIYGNYLFNPSIGGVQVGNRFTTINAPTSATNTAVGTIIRMQDDTSLGNTVRGLEVVASVGTNSTGINTGIRTTGNTFGIQAITTGLGGGVVAPAAVYAENTGTTQGDALRLYSASVTSASAMETIYHETSNFSGTGLLMNLGNTGGSFTGNFIDLKKNGTSQFTVLNNGGISSLGSIMASGTLAIVGTSTLGQPSSVAGVLSFYNASNAFTTTLRSSSTQAANLTFTLPATAGSAGQALTTDGAGGLYFGSVAGTISGGALGLVPRFTSSTTLATGLFIDNGTVAGVNASSSSFTFNVQGSAGVNAFNVASSTGTSLFTILQNGNVGIGSSTPGATLSITPSAGQMALLIASSTGATALAVNSAGYVSIGTTTPIDATTTVPLRVAGDIRVGNSGTNGCIQGNGGATLIGTCISDQNLKTNIFDITNVAEKFQSLRVINFAWNSVANAVYGNDMNATNTGYLAQNVESLFPELITTNAQGFKEVNYAAMNLYTAEGVKELSLAASQASTTLSTLGATVASNYAEASTSIASLMTTVQGNYSQASSSIATVNSLIVNNTASLQAQIDAIANKLNITNAPTSSIAISSTGVVGIGNDATQLGDEKLRVSGRVRATGFDIDTAADLAENFEAIEAVDAGTVVAFSTSTMEWSVKSNSTSTDDTYTMSTVRKAREASEAVGVISTNPGIVLGKSVVNGVPVAFSGRIPVKVTTENGEVKRGDYLTVSATMPGYAMKLTGEGRAIGRALSDYEKGRDKVLMVVESGLQRLDLDGHTATTTGMLTTGNIDLNANGVAITNIKSLASANGTWSIDENGRIVAKQLCLEDLCIDKTTLTNMLQVAGQAGMVLGTSTSTASSTQPAGNGSTATSTDTGSGSGTTSGDQTGTTTPTDTGSGTGGTTPPPTDSTPPATDTPPADTGSTPPADTGSTPPADTTPPADSTPPADQPPADAATGGTTP
jgi:hypothetical protein